MGEGYRAVSPHVKDAWADLDGDGAPDLFVGFGAGEANRL
jgi:hypothetical protein